MKTPFVFPKWTNKVPAIFAVSFTLFACFAIFAIWYWASPKNTTVGYQPIQPVAYSHKLHAGQLGIDCRYCHFNVERGRHAGVPPTDVCMNCHNLITRCPTTGTAEISKIREAHESGVPIKWVRIHKLAEFAYFDHSAHVNKGVSCMVCHGRVDQMDEVRAVAPLSMGWCLECHRNPAPNLRDRKLITNLAWKADGDPAELGKQFIEKYHVHPRTDCSTCHR